MDGLINAIAPNPLSAEDEAFVMELLRNKGNATPEDRKALDCLEQVIKRADLLKEKVGKL